MCFYSMTIYEPRKELALMEINFQARKLFKNAQNKLHILCLFKIMFHKNYSIIRILKKNIDYCLAVSAGHTHSDIWEFQFTSEN